MLISLLVEASKIFSLDRVHLHPLHLQLVFMVLQMGLVQGFFGLLPELKKSPKSAASPSLRVPASGSSWTRAGL